MSYPRFQRARDFKFFRRTAGNLSLGTGTSWANLPTIGTTWDVVLPAQVGDVVECGLSAVMDASSSTNTFWDVFTIVSGSAVNSVASGAAASNSDDGASGWFMTSGGIVGIPVSGSIMSSLVSGDISSGTVTLRLRYRQDGVASRALHATALLPLQFWAKNLGPMDPN